MRGGLSISDLGPVWSHAVGAFEGLAPEKLVEAFKASRTNPAVYDKFLEKGVELPWTRPDKGGVSPETLKALTDIAVNDPLPARRATAEAALRRLKGE